MTCSACWLGLFLLGEEEGLFGFEVLLGSLETHIWSMVEDSLKMILVKEEERGKRDPKRDEAPNELHTHIFCCLVPELVGWIV